MHTYYNKYSINIMNTSLLSLIGNNNVFKKYSSYVVTVTFLLRHSFTSYNKYVYIFFSTTYVYEGIYKPKFDVLISPTRYWVPMCIFRVVFDVRIGGSGVKAIGYFILSVARPK